MSDMSDFAGPSGLHLPTFFFFNDTATTEIYTLSLHDALPISVTDRRRGDRRSPTTIDGLLRATGWAAVPPGCPRSEEHTSELQSRLHLVCRLLLEKKKKRGAYKGCTCGRPEE